MRNLTVIEFISLDGVMQAPGAADEDTEGGFRHGGWNRQYFDGTLLAEVEKGMAATDAYLFGRITYQKLAAYWSTASIEEPFTEHLNQTPKYVASRTLPAAEWQNSTLISGDLIAEVRALKRQPGGNIAVLGSGNLVQTLITNDLVDAYFLVVCPLLLGGGKRLFRDHDQVRHLRLVGSTTTGAGSVILTYQPVRGGGAR